MEIILRKDVENVGFTDDVVIVKDGYGRNFLIPQGLGSLATESAKKYWLKTCVNVHTRKLRLLLMHKQWLKSCLLSN